MHTFGPALAGVGRLPKTFFSIPVQFQSDRTESIWERLLSLGSYALTNVWSKPALAGRLEWWSCWKLVVQPQAKASSLVAGFLPGMGWI